MAGPGISDAGQHRSGRRRLELLGLAAAAALLLSRPDLATLAAGLGLFLWGMTHLEEAIKRLSGGTLDRWLHAATRHPGVRLASAPWPPPWSSPAH